MIKKHCELKTETIQKLKGGDGEVRMTHLLTLDELSWAGRQFAVTVVPPKCSIGRHRHEGDFETYYILKGTAQVEDGDKIYDVQSGDVTICKDGACHSIRNVGDEDLEYIALILYSATNRPNDNT